MSEDALKVAFITSQRKKEKYDFFLSALNKIDVTYMHLDSFDEDLRIVSNKDGWGLALRGSPIDVEEFNIVFSWCSSPFELEYEKKSLKIQSVFEKYGNYKRGAIPLNSVEAINITESKIKTQKIFDQTGLHTPNTMIIELDEIAKISNGELDHFLSALYFPVVVKSDVGSGGSRVCFPETRDEVVKMAHKYLSEGHGILVQERILSPLRDRAQDIRVTVLYGEVVNAFCRTSSHAGMYASSGRLGATAELIEASEEQKELAIDALKLLGLNIGGVDLVGEFSDPYVIEVNDSPGIYVAEKKYDMKVAERIVTEFVQHAKIKV